MDFTFGVNLVIDRGGIFIQYHLIIMYPSVASLTIPRATPGIRTFSLPWARVFAQLSLLEGCGFQLEKFPTVLKEKCRNFSICFKETGGSLKSRCYCAVSGQFLQKQ